MLNSYFNRKKFCEKKFRDEKNLLNFLDNLLRKNKFGKFGEFQQNNKVRNFFRNKIC